MMDIYLGIGSNIGREQNIRDALHQLSEKFYALTLSTVYESEAVGFEGDNFYNLVVKTQTDRTIEQCVEIFHHIEASLGRKKSQPSFSARTIDIDLLLYGETVKTDAKPYLPSPDIENYPFVLYPLLEISPELFHPKLQMPLQQLWQQKRGDFIEITPVDFSWLAR